VKVLWLGDGGCSTGFGRVTHSIGERLALDFGHQVEVLAINHTGDWYPSQRYPEQATPLRLFKPDRWKTGDMYGNSRIIEMVGRHPDVIIALNDPQIILTQVLGNAFDPARVVLTKPFITYTPCDGYDLPPDWQGLKEISTQVVMSRFGQESYPGTKLIYHGVDPRMFWPVSEDRPVITSEGRRLTSKEECKRAIGVDPDQFLVLRVDTNSGRKDYGSLVKALVPVMQRHDDIQVWFHCKEFAPNGTNLPMLLSKYGLDIFNRFFFPDNRPSHTGWGDQDMNALYNAADMFVSTSRGEGFGLTLAEALLCKVPVIAQNVSAIPEVVGPGGVLLEPAMRLTVPSGEDVCLSDPSAFSEAIEELYLQPTRRQELGEAGHKHVIRSFDWDAAATSFDGLIRGLVT
jgi:glycosyltransferase involved in cell wall biosynthesis